MIVMMNLKKVLKICFMNLNKEDLEMKKEVLVSVQIRKSLLNRLIAIAEKDKVSTGEMVHKVLNKWCDMRERLDREKEEAAAAEQVTEEDEDEE